MNLLKTLTKHNPNSRIPFSLKTLVYAGLVTLFGTALLYCGISLAFMVGVNDVSKHPYEAPAITICLVVSLVFLLLSVILWLYTAAEAPLKWLNTLIAATVILVGFCPSFILMDLLYDGAEAVFHTILHS